MERQDLHSNIIGTRVQAPGLAVVLVGSRGDSETYVRSKKKACEEIGIQSYGTDLGEDVSQEELLKVPDPLQTCMHQHNLARHAAILSSDSLESIV